MKKLSIALLFFIPSLVFGASTLWEFYQPSMPSLSERAVIYANYFSDTYTGTAEQNTKLLTVLDSKEAPMILGASVLYPYQGGTGKGSVVVGDVGKYLKVSDDSPFTYSFDTPAGGAGDITGASSLGTGTNLFDTESAGVLRFNTISAGTNVTFSTSSNANTIVINSSGGGASFGQAWEINGLGKLAPTTTVAIAVGATGTSTFSGGIESGTKIGAPYFNATSTTATSTFAGGLSAAGSSGLTVLQNGNVGIGTTNPGAKFTVGSNLTVNTNPDVTISGHFVAGGSTGGVMVGYTGNTIQGRTGTGSVLNTNGNLNLNPYGGNVGIGTTTPQRKLEIYDGASGGVGNSNAELVLEDNGNAGLSILGTTVHSGSIYFGDSTNNALGVIQYGLSSHATNANALMFQTNASEKMRITSNGNVGIGTTSPSYLLHAERSTNGIEGIYIKNPNTGTAAQTRMTVESASSALTFSAYPSTYSDAAWADRVALFGESSAAGINIAAVGASADIRLMTGGAAAGNERVRIESTGNLGIGTTSPAAKLSINQGSTGLGMYLAGYSNNTSDLFRISTSTLLATSTAFVINSNGKVGIGTTTPSQQLSVAGNGYFSGQVSTPTIIGALTGNASTATALAADGADCSAGSFPLGVDASGAVVNCTDAWTEAENTSAAYAAQATTLTIAGTASQITSSAGAQSLAANRTWTLSLPNYLTFPLTFTSLFGTTTNFSTASSTIGKLTAGSITATSSLTFGGVTGTAWTDFCTTITGGSGLCDGDDATSAGGGTFSWTPTTNFGANANSTSTPIWLTGSPYSLMASSTVVLGGGVRGTAFIPFSVLGSEATTTNFATLDTRNNHPVLDFDTTTQECAYWTDVMPYDYGGSGVTVKTTWAATSATTGTGGWTVAFERFDDSVLDLDTVQGGFSARSTITALTVPGTSGVVATSSVNIANGSAMDSIIGGETFRLEICRDVANDTAAGDLELLGADLIEQ